MACFVPLSASVMTPSFHWVGLGWVEIFKLQLGWVGSASQWARLGSHKMDPWTTLVSDATSVPISLVP